MKKVLIGCGVLLVLVLAGFAYLAYELGPQIMESQERSQAGAEELVVLDDDFPFSADAEETFNADRFAAMLDARIAVGARQRSRDEAFRTETEERELGALEAIKMKLGSEPSLMDLADELAVVEMGPTEFSHYTRIMWAALQRVGAGLGPAELEPLRGFYDNLSKGYEAMSFLPNIAPLDEVLGEFDRAVTDTAMEVMGRRADGLMEGGVQLSLEPLYLNINQLVATTKQARRAAADLQASEDR